MERDIESGVLVDRYNQEVLAQKRASLDTEANDVVGYLSALKEKFKAATGMNGTSPTGVVTVAPDAPKA